MINREEFERVEGVFHDGLGTFFELLVANRLIEEYALNQPMYDLTSALDKMQSATARLSGDPRGTILQLEMEHIRSAAVQAVAQLRETLAEQVPARVEHCAGQYAGGLAADLRLVIPGHEDVPVSLKTDKSGKVALADIGQTSNLYRWFSDLFQMSDLQLEQLCLATTGLSLAEARRDFQNISLLVQTALITELGLSDAEINNLARAVPTNELATRHLFRRVKFHKSGHDRAIVLTADRRTGEVRGDTRIDEVDPDSLELTQVGFPPCTRTPYRYCATIGVKYEGVTVFTFQIKHMRGKGVTPQNRHFFGDITTRLER